MWLQEALNDLGIDHALIVGLNGPATIEAIKWFQGIASIPVDGIAGNVTREAIKLRLGH
jgi:peptidoglycan hydrolase-like protein with peptidoglycan-binding domain